MFEYHKMHLNLVFLDSLYLFLNYKHVDMNTLNANIILD